jgi:hypothetical protein
MQHGVHHKNIVQQSVRVHQWNAWKKYFNKNYMY